MAQKLLIIMTIISMGYLCASAAHAKSSTDSYYLAQNVPVEHPTTDEDKGTSSGSGYGIEETDFC